MSVIQELSRTKEMKESRELPKVPAAKSLESDDVLADRLHSILPSGSSDYR